MRRRDNQYQIRQVVSSRSGPGIYRNSRVKRLIYSKMQTFVAAVDTLKKSCVEYEQSLKKTVAINSDLKSKVDRMAEALAERLKQRDPEHANNYEQRWQDFQQRWQTAMKQWQEKTKELSQKI